MIQSVALATLLGFELSYYLLIVQTGIAQHYHSDILQLFPLFVGGVAGTLFSGQAWGNIANPIHKIIIALSLQLVLSGLYPEYNVFTLGLLGISVGLMAPLGIYLFKEKQQKELLFALAIAYTVGTSGFTTVANERAWMALLFTLIALASALVLKRYKVEEDAKIISHTFVSYLPLMLWIMLDSNLFETLSRHAGLNIWSNQTLLIITFHLCGLIAAYFIRLESLKNHLFVALLFLASYALSYLELPLILAIVYPFTISYYNVVVFTALSKEMSLAKLAFMMVFIGWIASGLGLALALSKLLH
jgi:hypothetical protein